MSRIVRDGDEEYIVYIDEERCLAMRLAVIAIWLFVIWLLVWFVLRPFVDFFPFGLIGVILGIAALSGFSTSVEGRSRLDDDGD